MIDKHKKFAACQIKQDDVNEMIYHIMNLKFQPKLMNTKIDFLKVAICFAISYNG